MRAARDHAVAILREHLPATWRVVDSLEAVEAPDRPTVLVRLQRIRREPTRPLGAYRNTLTLSLLSSFDDRARAQHELEDGLDVLLAVVEQHFGTAWEEAELVIDPDSDRLSWDVSLFTITSRTQE